jgi:signal transduction histidine kinase
VVSILGHYAALAVQNTAHLEALKLAEDQRATTETFAAIGDIAANLLHRLNNKVGTIPVRVEGIQDKCEALIRSDPYLATNLAEIQHSAAEAMQVVRESLDHLRPIQLAPVSVAACVQNAISTTRLPDGVRVEIQGLEALPTVQAGAERLNLVFANLLENAADAMGGIGKVQILGAVQGKWVEVQVSDTGPGIPPELHERIFEFNYSTRTSHPGKLGFGLWWVKSLVTRFGGKVAVESANGHGTTFILSLPLSGSDV